MGSGWIVINIQLKISMAVKKKRKKTGHDTLVHHGKLDIAKPHT